MIFWRILGLFFVALGTLGVFLPLLPTTVFILAAAWCFARSSPKLHAWLLGNRTFGPMIRDWEANRCVSLRVKVVALSMIIFLGGPSIFFGVPAGWPRIGGFILLATGAVVVSSLRVCGRNENKA